ncbi:MAG TPA: hypothetical protein VF119_10920 [Candidatus Limnocylindrales bacterium]
MSPEQLGAVAAVRALDPDAIATLDDDALRAVLAGFSMFAPESDPEARRAAREASNRFLDEIM